MNPPTFLQRLLGANSKVRAIIIGLIISYTLLRFPAILSGLPDDLRNSIFSTASEFLHYGLFLAMWFLKQNNVTGAGTSADPHVVSKSDGTATPIVPALIAMCVAGTLLTGCLTDAQYQNVQAFQANPKVQTAEKVAGTIALDFLLNAAKTEASGGKFNSAWAVSTGLNSLADVVPQLDNSTAAATISQTAQNFAGDQSFKPVAQKLAAAYVAANPQTPAQKTATVVALASGVQSGTQTATQAVP